jgi:hypothetical protein
MNSAMAKGSIDNNQSSLILTARYGHESSKLIHLIEKNLYIVIGLIVFMAVLSIVNAIGFHYLLQYSEDIDFIVDVSLAVILIAMVIPLITILLKSRNSLDRWDDMFETNTLSISIGISMSNRTIEEAFRAIMQSVEQINQPLNDYFTASKSNLKEFMNVSVDKNITFDILIDSNRVLDGNKNKDSSNKLRDVLRAYGAIVVKIIDGKTDKVSVESYVNSFLQYTSRTKSQVGLAIVIGEEISSEAQEYANQMLHKHKRNRKIDNLILIEKPSSSPPSSTGAQEVVIT